MKTNNKKHPLLLLYVLCTILIPVLHTGGLICPHSHNYQDLPISVLCCSPEPSENSFAAINDKCNEHDESICPICHFYLTLSQIPKEYRQFKTVLSVSAFSNIKPQDFIIIKYRIFSNPSTAPPSFTI